MPKSSKVPRLNTCAMSRAKDTTSKKVLFQYLHQTLRCDNSILRSLRFRKQRNVKPTDVLYFFGDMPGDGTIRIETNPQKAVCGVSNPKAQGVMLQDGVCVDANGKAFPSLNQWIKAYVKDSPWRKAFFKGQPFEIYRQILIQERPDLFRPGFHEKNRKKIGHKDYLKDHIKHFGITVSTDVKTLSSQDSKQKSEASVGATKFEVVAAKILPTHEYIFDDELLAEETAATVGITAEEEVDLARGIVAALHDEDWSILPDPSTLLFWMFPSTEDMFEICEGLD
jgi:hypothetical protein